MEDKEKKSKLKEVLKAAGVTGAGAAIGALHLPSNALSDALDSLAYYENNLGAPFYGLIHGKGAYTTPVDRNPGLGIGLNAAASGLGALAAYGVLKGVTNGVKKAIHNRDEKKLELAKAYGEAVKSGRA